MRSSAHSQQKSSNPKDPETPDPCSGAYPSCHPATEVVRYSPKATKKKRSESESESKRLYALLSPPRLGTEKRGADINTRPTVPVIDGRFVASYGGGYRMGRLRVLREECDVSRPLCIDKHLRDQSQAAAASMTADHPLIGHHYRSRIK